MFIFPLYGRSKTVFYIIGLPALLVSFAVSLGSAVLDLSVLFTGLAAPYGWNCILFCMLLVVVFELFE